MSLARFVTFWSAVFVLSLNISVSQNLKLKFYNKTGKDIKNFVAFGKTVKLLKNNDSTVFIKYDSLDWLRDGFIGDISGEMQGKKVERWADLPTASLPYQKKKGTYRYDVFLVEFKDAEPALTISKHKKK